jgi:hypothetical protein
MTHSRKRKVVVIIVLALLGVGLAVFLVTRDSGPPVVVHGNVSAKDVAQIKSAVRRELWRDAFPNFSWATIKALPRSMRRVQKVRIVRISGLTLFNGTHLANVRIEEPHEEGRFQPPYDYDFTNGPNGWTFSHKFVPE